MSPAPLVKGFDYANNTQVAYTPAQWRARYPGVTHERSVLDGDTLYRYILASAREGRRSRLVAEAYAVIPCDRATP